MLRDYLPSYLHEIQELSVITEVEQQEINVVTDAINKIAQDFSVFTLRERGIIRWEGILSIAGKIADDIDSRRFRIISRILEQLPITKRSLYTQLETLCGKDGFTLEINGSDYTMLIKVNLISKSAFQDVTSLIHRSIPANILARVQIMYNSHATLNKFSHDQLAAKTHCEIRNEVL